MGEQTPRTALLRLAGEIGIKSKATRRQFRKRLHHNLRDALVSAGLEPRIEESHDRIYIELPDSTTGLADHPLARVFGLQSLSLVERHPVTAAEDIVRTAAALFVDAVRGKRFAVRARRVGTRGPARPRDVERDLGTALLPYAAGVDLSHPEVTVGLELTVSDTAFFTERAEGTGGLPLGVEGSAVALLSGGFDSAVAAWQMQKRGVALDYVFCNLGGPTHLQGVVRVAKLLADNWSYGIRPRLHVIDFEPVADALRQHTRTRFWQILLKRQMLWSAEAVARERRAAAIVTGEVVGQVSSQTLQNLAVIDRATQQPVLRPLVGFNKEEITAIAQRIGTFDLSKVVGEYCAMVPSKPATRAALGAIEAEEARLPADLLADPVDRRQVIDLREFDPSSLEPPDLAVDRVPDGAIVLDLRPVAQFRTQHHPDALHLEFSRAVSAYASFEREAVYVVSCEFGLLSSHLAQQMRAEGFRVFHFRGGQRALMRSAGPDPNDGSG